MKPLPPITQQDLAPLTALMPAEYPAVWKDMACSLFTRLLRPAADEPQLGLAPEALARLALELTVALANDIGGDTVYIPIGHFLRAGETARKVIAAFRGHNHFECAKLADITVSRVRQILREHQQAQFLARQGRLDV